MAAVQRLALRLDLGPRAEIQAVAAALDDIGTVCTFAGELQRLSDRNQVFQELLRGPEQRPSDMAPDPDAAIESA